MTKTTIAFYIALIFLAGGVAGAGIATAWKPEHAPLHQGPPRPPEDFQTHIFNRMKERLALTPPQIEKVEPVFRKGFDEVRAVQDRSIKEVEAAVKRNHDEIATLVTPEQRQKLEEMDREREKMFRERRGHHHGPGPSPEGMEPGGRPAHDLILQKDQSGSPKDSKAP